MDLSFPEKKRKILQKIVNKLNRLVVLPSTSWIDRDEQENIEHAVKGVDKETSIYQLLYLYDWIDSVEKYRTGRL